MYLHKICNQMYLIGVKGIRIKAPLGVYDWEKQKARDFVVDIELNLDLKDKPLNDDLSQTINYEKLVKQVVDTLMKGGNLLEFKVEEIGQNLLKEFVQIKELKVRLSKLNPMNDDLVEKSFVERIFKQSEY